MHTDTIFSVHVLKTFSISMFKCYLGGWVGEFLLMPSGIKLVCLMSNNYTAFGGVLGVYGTLLLSFVIHVHMHDILYGKPHPFK
jgi:hypothetical protein